MRSANYHEAPEIVHTIPAGMRIRLDTVHDQSSITVCLVDEKDKAIPLPGVLLRDHYRFDVPNAILGPALGITLPVKQRDIVAEIMHYEQGDATPKEERSLFAELRRSGLGYRLQGHYSSRM